AEVVLTAEDQRRALGIEGRRAVVREVVSDEAGAALGVQDLDDAPNAARIVRVDARNGEIEMPETTHREAQVRGENVHAAVGRVLAGAIVLAAGGEIVEAEEREAAVTGADVEMMDETRAHAGVGEAVRRVRHGAVAGLTRLTLNTLLGRDGHVAEGMHDADVFADAVRASDERRAI